MERLTDRRTAEQVRENIEGLIAAGIEPSVGDVRYVKLAEYEDKEEDGVADVQPVDRWISVDDRLPDTMNDCLVWYSCDTAFGKSKNVGISFYWRDAWYTKKLDGDNIVVLYWMPCPEPPKEG